MIFQQILNEESGCLSYLVGCGQAGRAVIVDPGRDRVHEYLRLARRRGLTITHVLETHTHADHIAGNRDLPPGAGSACGRAMSAKTGSTIGFERRFNAALGLRDRAAFVDFIMRDLPPKPPQFEKIVGKNRGLIPLHSAKPRPYAAREAWEAVQRGECVVDLRDPGTYGESHIPGALNVWIDSPQFAERVAWAVPTGVPLLLLAPGPSDLERAVQALSRVGVDEVAGYLHWGMIEWKSGGFPVESVPQITVHDLAEWLEEGRDLAVIDVREPFEWLDGHIEGAIHLPMMESVARRRR